MNRWIFAGFLLAGGCTGSSSVVESHGEEEVSHEHSVIRVDGNTLKELGIGFYVVDSGYIYRNYMFPANIIESSNSSAMVRARFPGIVVKLLKYQGDRVKHGDVVAFIESDESFSRYPVYAPIDGVVSSQMVSTGESVEKGQPIMKIVDLREVWVKGMIYPEDANRVRKGQRVEVHRHFGDEYVILPGKIFMVSPELDEETRLLPVFISVDNRNGLLKPGMYGDVIVRDSQKVSMRIPAQAVHVIDSDTLIFLKKGDAVHRKRVSLGIRGEEFVQVLSGLNIGDTVFSRNSFMLRAEFEKESWVGEGHSH